MTCQRAKQDEVLGAGCVCVCVEHFCGTDLVCTQKCAECVCAHVPTGNTHWGQGPAVALPLLGHWICQLVIVTCSYGPAVRWEPRIVSARTILLPEQKG